MSFLLSLLVKMLTGGTVDKVLDYMQRKALVASGDARARFEVQRELVKAAVDETRIMADLNKAKLGNAFFWFLISLFVVPLAIWWTAVIADSLFLFSWNVAALPEPLNEWAGDMVRWLFYTGTAAAMFKAVK
ncbi:hypothetical protein [Roseibium litorale]|uniref:Holin of 3TMs, for gene-transfer release n=1 Tax=Roseibium litorale TaxID=2803841 RepID=A0ABR9CH29_9HYPH|nr:hypothetical protein [Roseibium litorale]MBD8890165.1 hypothetical protein [Roseibium litorale]